MRLILTLSFALIFSLTFAQKYSQEDRFHMSVEDVLKMGHDKWFAWYTSGERGTESTLGMSEAHAIYADCLSVRNRRLMMDLGPNDQSWLTSVESDLETIGKTMGEAGFAISGGGTIWIPLFSHVSVEVQQCLYDLIKSTPKPLATQDSVWASWRKGLAEVRKHKDDIATFGESTGTTFETVEKTIYGVNGTFNHIVMSSKNQKAARKGRLFATCKVLMDLVFAMN